MRKLTTTALLLVLIALLADVGILAISSALDSEAENAVMAYAAALEQYKALHGPKHVYSLNTKEWGFEDWS